MKKYIKFKTLYDEATYATYVAKLKELEEDTTKININVDKIKEYKAKITTNAYEKFKKDIILDSIEKFKKENRFRFYVYFEFTEKLNDMFSYDCFLDKRFNAKLAHMAITNDIRKLKKICKIIYKRAIKKK